MISLKKQMWAKVLAAVLCFAAVLCLIAELACTVFLYGFNAYTQTDEDFRSSIYDKIAYDYACAGLEALANRSPDIISEIEKNDTKTYDLSLIHI